MRFKRAHRLAFACASFALALPSIASAVEPHRSIHEIVSSNGRAAISYDPTQYKITQFLEHPYAQLNASTTSRNFAFDNYPGVRIGGAGNAGTWLNTVTPSVMEYVPGTGIVHIARNFSGLSIDEYEFAPQTLTENAAVALVKVTRTSGAGPIDVYELYNFHLGSGSPAPGTDSENITFDNARGSFYESGPAGVTFGYNTIGASSFHGCTPDNPFALLNSGADLPNTAGTGGPTTDAVPGFQNSLGDLAVGSSGWAGFYAVLASDSNGAGAIDRVTTWVNGRTPDKILADEMSTWSSWITPPPAGASADEASIASTSQVMLKMGQVTEPGQGSGQILASLPPGAWNITWVRDMAYSVVGLIRTKHYAEAKAAIQFQLGAQVGSYQQYVGKPYQISVVRYYGDGSEWSDSNADGPNIEFDGFGLFLWELNEYVKASGDTAFLTTSWPAVKSKIGDVLVGLQQNSGLISADSSIWEVHWNGKQRQFAYTTITAAAGLCAASKMAQNAGDSASATAYETAGEKARDAILATLRAPDGTIGQSVEGLASGVQWLDAAAMEAMNLGLVWPNRRTGDATLASIESGLVPPSGRGFMRSDIPADYDSHEWVFIDLRSARARELNGDMAGSASGFLWNVDQGMENFGELSELHDPLNADYAGQAPMVGFGAGAYLISLTDRGTPGQPACAAYADEPALLPDGGVADDGGGIDADGGTGANDDGGPGSSGGPGSGSSSGGCGCDMTARAPAWGAIATMLAIFAAISLRRRRS